jgi:hypothetical protein
MNIPKIITKQYFIKRLGDLCLRSGLSGFPAGREEQHILMKSAVLGLDPSGTYTEREIDSKLQFWISEIVELKGIDHVTMRRCLIDAGYLARNKEGTCYQISAAQQPYSFESDIEQLDIATEIQNERDRIALRKKEYLERQIKGKS